MNITIFSTDKGRHGLEHICEIEYGKTGKYDDGTMLNYVKMSDNGHDTIILRFTKDSQVYLIRNGREFCLNILNRWSL